MSGEVRWIAAASASSTEEERPWRVTTYTVSGFGCSSNEAIGAAFRALIDGGARSNFAYHTQPLPDGEAAGPSPLSIPDDARNSTQKADPS